MFSLKKQPTKRPASRAKANKKKNTGLISRLNWSRKEAQFMVFIAVFAVIGGGIYVYRSFAATPCRDRVYSRGSKGDCVRALQVNLLGHGSRLPKYGPDGDFGAETEAAVRAFQDSGDRCNTGCLRPSDGVVGSNTIAHLCANNLQTRYDGRTSAFCAGTGTPPPTGPNVDQKTGAGSGGSTATNTPPPTTSTPAPNTRCQAYEPGCGAPALSADYKACLAYKKSGYTTKCGEATGSTQKYVSKSVSAGKTICIRYFGSGDIQVQRQYNRTTWLSNSPAYEKKTLTRSQESCYRNPASSGSRTVLFQIGRLSKGEVFGAVVQN